MDTGFPGRLSVCGLSECCQAGRFYFTEAERGMLLEWLAILDSSRTFIREETAYSGITGTTRIWSTTSNIILLYPDVFVKRLEHKASYFHRKLN